MARKSRLPCTLRGERGGRQQSLPGRISSLGHFGHELAPNGRYSYGNSAAQPLSGSAAAVHQQVLEIHGGCGVFVAEFVVATETLQPHIACTDDPQDSGRSRTGAGLIYSGIAAESYGWVTRIPIDRGLAQC